MKGVAGYSVYTTECIVHNIEVDSIKFNLLDQIATSQNPTLSSYELAAN